MNSVASACGEGVGVLLCDTGIGVDRVLLQELKDKPSINMLYIRNERDTLPKSIGFHLCWPAHRFALLAQGRASIMFGS